MCGCECCIYAKITNSSLLSRRKRFEKLKDQSCNAQNRRSGETENHLFETYKNTVMPHGKHIFQIAFEMSMATMCAYPSSKYALPHWKCMLRCCAQYTRIDLPSPKSYQHNLNVIPPPFLCLSNIAYCIVNGRQSFNEKTV